MKSRTRGALAASALILTALTTAACSAQSPSPSASHQKPDTSVADARSQARATCGYTADGATPARDSEVAVQSAEVDAEFMEPPPGVPVEWDDELKVHLNPTTGEPADLTPIPTHVFDGDGGVNPGPERADANGEYRQVIVPQSAEVVSQLDSWDRAPQEITDKWSRAHFYLAQDFAVCFLLTWFLDNPAILDRSPETLETYATESAELVPHEFADDWIAAVTDVDAKNMTSTTALQKAVNEGGDVGAYDPDGVRYELSRLHIRTVTMSESGATLFFEVSYFARYPSVIVDAEGYPNGLPVKADGVLTIGVKIDDDVPYITALQR